MKAKTKNKKSKEPQIDVYRKCFICGAQYGDQNLDSHMHSYLHHKAIERVKGSEQLHKCWACNVSVMGLEQYKDHISTRKHTYSLYKLHNSRKKMRLRVDYSVDLTNEESVALQRQRQKETQQVLETCFVCCQRFPVQDFHVHMHTIFHHQVIEQLKGSPQVHKCWACDMSKTGMVEFKQHVRTLYHKYKLFELQKNTADGKIVDYSVEFEDLRSVCDQRDQMKQKKREKRKRWKEGKRQKEQLSIQTVNMDKDARWTAPMMAGEEFTNDQLPPSCHFFSSWENQNNTPASIQLNQNPHKQRKVSTLDMDISNVPLMKGSCHEIPSENRPHEMSSHGPHPIQKGKGAEMCTNELTPETEAVAFVEPPCFSGLVPNRMEVSKPNLTTARGVCSIQKETVENEAVVPERPLQKHPHSKKSVRKVNGTVSPGTSREGMNGLEPSVDSVPSVTLAVEPVENQTSDHCQELETVEKVRPHTVHVRKKKSNECDTEQRETPLKNHNSTETNSCNVWKTKKKKQDVSNDDVNPDTNDQTSRKRKVNKLLTLSLKEDEFTRSLEDVGDQLTQAYATLQTAYTEVQRLLAVKQQVTSEMSSLRDKRIQILQDMTNASDCSSHSDQQVVLNAS